VVYTFELVDDVAVHCVFGGNTRSCQAECVGTHIRDWRMGWNWSVVSRVNEVTHCCDNYVK